MVDRSVAVIGYGAKLPNAPDSDSVWQVLTKEECVIGDVPPDRWSSQHFVSETAEAPGKSYVARAGLVEDVFDFDNGHFGVTPRDANQMDPQQRLLLETVAAALDHAAIDPTALDRSTIGVFVGASSSDHSTTALEDPDVIGASYMVGNTLSILSNRISFTWDLQGPSYTVDTACASGLFALDQARRAIARDEIDTAIVAGVNVLLSPVPFVGFSKAQMLSRTGLCRAFAKDADGYVRSEGAVVFILRAEKAARAHGDQIRSLLVATGTNCDGRTPGISQPKSETQEALITSTRKRFKIDPDDLAYFEAHGTGTAVGDPEEARAIGLAYGKHRTSPLPLGSAKTNFGHLEPASGLVGLLKAQLTLEHEVIPASLHCEELNPNIDFKALGLEVVRESRPLQKRREPWLAAVNSFGFGGANAHAVLKQVPKEAAVKERELPKALCVSASSEEALRELAASWQKKARADGHDFATEVSAANTRLSRHRHRLCLSAGTAECLDASIGSWLAGERSATAASGTTGSEPRRIGFVFPGNGAQWAGMGRQEYLTDLVFRASFNETSELFQAQGLQSLVDTLMAPDLSDCLGRATIAQPLLLAVQIALVDVLAHQGVKPHAAVGHSAGEFAAAYAAGAMTRENAVYSVFIRSKTFDGMYDAGGMMALATSLETAERLIGDTQLPVDIAAVNSANNVTVSGPSSALESLKSEARKSRVAGKLLPIKYPYHSRLVEPFREQMLEDMNAIECSDPSIDLYSGYLARKVYGCDLTTDYWWGMTRSRVQFQAAISEMLRDGIGLFIEMSGRSVLKSNITAIAGDLDATAEVIGTLEDHHLDIFTPSRTALEALANGASMDESVLLGRNVPFAGSLPVYPFRRTTYRLGSDKALNIFGRFKEHPLLGSQVAHDLEVWTNDLSLGRHPWLGDHRVGKDVVVPATAIIEMFRAAAETLRSDTSVALADLELLHPIVLSERTEAEVRVRYEAASDRLTLEQRAGKAWQMLAFATVNTHAASTPRSAQPASMRPAEDLYDRLENIGLHYGPNFALVRALARDGMQVATELQTVEPTSDPSNFDPCILDAGLHGIVSFLPTQELKRPYVPGRIGQIITFPGQPVVRSDIKLRSASSHGVCVDVTYYDAARQPRLVLEELWLRPFHTMPNSRHAYWDEHLVPVSPQVTSTNANVAVDAVMAGKPDSNLDVIRQSMAGRIGFDLMAQAETGENGNSRKRAEEALGRMGLWTRDGNGRLVPSAPCPWPDLDTLIPLLVSTCPSASDTLNGVLRNVTGHAPEDAGLGLVANRVMSALSGQSIRILLAGNPNAAMLRVLGRGAAHVVVGVADADATQATELLLNTHGIAAVMSFESLSTAPKFDFVLCVDGSSSLSLSHYRNLARFVAPGGALLALDRSDDLFEAMTRPAATEKVRQFAASLLQRGFEVENYVAPDEPSVSLFVARAAQDAPSDGQVPDFVVEGQGNLFDALAAALPDSLETTRRRLIVLPEATDALDAATAQAGYFGRLDNTEDPVWIVQRGVEWAPALRAWRRCIVNETGHDLRVVSIDETTTPSQLLRHLSTSDETEIELHGGQAFAPRLQRHWVEPCPDAEQSRYVLDLPGSFQMNNLSWQLERRVAPEGKEIEIEVTSTGMNFRDVLWAQGLLPPEMLEGGFVGAALGMECAGTVVRAGPDASLEPGCPVVAFVQGAFASHVTTSEDNVMPLPNGANLRTAPSIPVAFLTSVYALEELGNLRKGETVLVHGAAGGLGLAAIQVAQMIGATVIATAGNPAKRKLLETLGVQQVLDSRSLAFAAEVKALTGGRGVDVVLNSLAGEALKQSLGCMAPFGRFIELGKRDFMANTPLALRAMRKNISFHGVDVDQLLNHRPEAAKRIMAQIIERYQSGTFEALPTTLFPAEDVSSAFRTMQKSGHIGKIAVCPKKPVEGVKAASNLGATWLVTGGTSGFGFATACWLAGKGVKALWLASRTGRLSSEQTELLRNLGATAHVVSLDVSDQAGVASLMLEIEEAGQGLDGVVHCAALYGDGLFKDAEMNDIAARLGVKLGGAMNLDVETRRFDLQHFWMYGSIAARFGNPGQSDYAAANAAMEAIAARRQSQGLAGTTIAWGPVGDVGYLQRSKEVGDVIAAQIGPLEQADQALSKLDTLLASGNLPPAVTIAAIDWTKLTDQLALRKDKLFEKLAKPVVKDSEDETINVVDLIAELGTTKARTKLIDIIRAEVATIIQAAPSDIDINRPLVDIGLDSLMGLNLKMAVEERMGQTLPLLSIGDGLTLANLANEVIEIATGEAEHRDTRTQMVERHVTQQDVKSKLTEGRTTA